MKAECEYFLATESLFSPMGPCRYWHSPKERFGGYCSHRDIVHGLCATDGMKFNPRADQESDSEE
jgi:hypothetical protein